MLVECCYRLGPSGSVIHDKWDVLNHTVLKNPELILPSAFNTETADYTLQHYNVRKPIDHHAMVEAVLLSDPKYVFVKDFSNRYYDAATDISESTIYRKDTPEEPYTSWYTGAVMDNSENMSIGIEITIYHQLRYVQREPFQIYMTPYPYTIYTSQGNYRLPDHLVEKVIGYQADLRPYKKLRDDERAVGFIYLEDGYGILYKDTKEIKEVPYGI